MNIVAAAPKSRRPERREGGLGERERE